MVTTQVDIINSDICELDHLYRDHGDLILRTALGVTRVREDAEDVLQIVFLRLLKSGSSPDLQRNPRGYLYRAAMNVSLDIIRSRSREASKVAAAQLALPFANTESEAPQKALEILERAIEQLDDRTKILLNRRYYEDRSDSEIAELLGTTRGSVSVSLVRARTKVRTLIGTLEPTGGDGCNERQS